ncbi:hypothetical protein [Devosia beringensis]|uniref:hypothetical protein n=1 Tax=Devosia beringensis TaxID=2657486 RepID=UPI00186B9CFD|nr:hypothetical protein [Devosia beringensis]
MVKAFRLVAATLLISAGVSAPAFALTLTAAVDQCAAVAVEEQRSDEQDGNPLRGYCLNATAEFLSTVNSNGLSRDEIGTELATYVVALAGLVNQSICRTDSEIPQAISMAGAASEDPDQAEQIRLISQAVIECVFSTTAALPRTFPAQTESGSDDNRSDVATLRTPLLTIVDTPIGIPVSPN